MPFVPSSPIAPSGLHPRNPHRARYDFAKLVRACPELARFVIPHPGGGETVDFFDPTAVTTLNRALLRADYGLASWDLPPGALCPPIPGRADYLLHVADLVAADANTAAAEGKRTVVRGLDIGTGANCIYPILGVLAHGWRFVATDIAPASITWARQLVAANTVLKDRIECRLQSSPDNILDGVVRAGEKFAFCVCNPPFHASAAEAEAAAVRKLRNLGDGRLADQPVLNFGGQQHELWCEGGEVAFVRRMIAQSALRPDQCRWFTTLVSKRGSLSALQAALAAVNASEVRVIPMTHGQKHSRILAWNFRSITSPARHAN